MSSWGISQSATQKEKLKNEYAEYLHGLNATCEIDYPLYCQLFDFGMMLLDRMYDLGAKIAGEVEDEID